MVFRGKKDDDYRGPADARAEILATGNHIEGDCSLNPVWVSVVTSHFCGQWKARDFEGDVETFLYRYTRYESFEKRYDELRAQLQSARKLSAKRLAKLKKLTGATNG